MRVNAHAVVTALNLYYGGLSMRKLADNLENIFGEKVSQSTIHYWIHKYASLAKDYVESLQPKLSGKYHHDETEIKVSGNGRYFWETIDEDTRFIVGSLLTEIRTSEKAIKVLRQAFLNKDRLRFSLMVRLRIMMHLTRYSIPNSKQTESNGLDVWD
jgi:transposase-like protein